jgi:hypothetical protein
MACTTCALDAKAINVSDLCLPSTVMDRGWLYLAPRSLAWKRFAK